MNKHDLEVAYIGIEVPDPSALTSFLHNVVGLVPGDPSGSGEEVSWRNDDRAHRIILEPGEANDATFVGLEATSGDGYGRILARLAAAGHDVAEATHAECTERQVDRMVRVSAPWGIQIEICQTLALSDKPFSSVLNPGGFFTDGVGFGHVVFATPAFEESHQFLIDGLGFSQSDWLEMEIAEGIELEVRFYHCNERHHTIALAKAPFELPQKLHHIMLETNNRDDVGVAFDRAWASELPIPNGLGLHDNDRMFSFYVESPAGFQVEIGHGARTIGDDWDDNRCYDSISAWGHQPLQRS